MNPRDTSQYRHYVHPKKSNWLPQNNASSVAPTQNTRNIQSHPAVLHDGNDNLPHSYELVPQDAPLDFSKKRPSVSTQNGSASCQEILPSPVKSAEDRYAEISHISETNALKSHATQTPQKLEGNDSSKPTLNVYSCASKDVEPCMSQPSFKESTPQFPTQWAYYPQVANVMKLSAEFGTLPVVPCPVPPHINGHLLPPSLSVMNSLQLLPTNIGDIDALSGTSLIPVPTTPAWPLEPDLNGEKTLEKSNLFKKYAPEIISRNYLNVALHSSDQVPDTSSHYRNLDSAKDVKDQFQLQQSNQTTGISPETSSILPLLNSSVGESSQKSNENDNGAVNDSSREMQDNEPSSSSEPLEASIGCSSRKKARPLPAELKDVTYRMKRDKNNIAAKRSRDNRRKRNNCMAIEARRYECKKFFLEQAIVDMTNKLMNLKQKISEAEIVLNEKHVRMVCLENFSRKPACNKCGLRFLNQSNNEL